LIWSVVPQEMIFAGSEKLGSCRELNYQGRLLLVNTKGENPGEGRIVRLLSSDPADFMDGLFAPGRVIPLS